MTNPTDTNQASEDDELQTNVLENIFSELCIYMYGNDMGSMTEYRIPRFRLQEAKTAIQSAIRTEKLKLLAEVRERVVGENQHSEHKEWDCPCGATHSFTEEWHATNRLRDDQRENLTKLEAEL